MKLWICSNLQEQEAGSLQSANAFKDSLFHFVYKIFNVFLVIETSFFQRFFISLLTWIVPLRIISAVSEDMSTLVSSLHP